MVELIKISIRIIINCFQQEAKTMEVIEGILKVFNPKLIPGVATSTKISDTDL